ncbi:phage tail protein [Salmonella enterica]|uniref:Phage tail protein n=4 Tax=Salmonella enterica TaxID=28901 RepID=A0A5W2M4N7_SALET|nr:phage tail protein [Salmonella enterica]EAA3556098.1 phage tail protein [Salmonella enterica subsp. enterica serovar Montevideo]EAA4001856.1 phage tail protein [Salmonella enterica subsp. enterica serovar Ealing]EAB7820767.1 phage tail protein [Salmonella enterica subsp. enterica]EAB8010008.1 phage tail protein [Salmonella enterica subsp. enterica serovar Muenchen]EBG8047129.1 phage tail protein [Salmonella enterica subsp. enterica serovar Oranienburg]EBG9518225.1 phage tail protein [Salmo
MKKESAEYDVDVTTEATSPVKGVTLTKPIVRGDETITYVEIGDAIKQSGSLRGLSLSDVLNMKTDTLVTLFTRVTSPRLKESEIAKLATSDFIALSTAIVPFLTPTASGVPNGVETDD